VDGNTLHVELKKISVITINFNNKLGLEKTIQSVISQPLFKEHIEYIIIDGGSNDCSVETIKEFEGSIHFWVSEKDGGIFYAMNKGLQKATGEYVIFMNSGDVFCNNLIDKRFIDSLNTQLVYGNYYLESELPKNLCKQTETIDFAYLLGKTICHQALFMQRDLCVKYPFEYQFNIIGDWIQLFKIMKNENPSIKYVNQVICIYDIEGLSIQQNDKRLLQRAEFLSLNYGAWELETLKKLGRLRSRDFYFWVMNSVDSYKRGIAFKWLKKII
jgi:glycosyltransferase involved in cell wall biosynthesis